MKEQVEARHNPGVYALDGRGRETLVHLYQGGDYELADIVEFFQLGRLEEADGEDETVQVLTAKELLTLNRRRYHRDFWALRDVSFEVERGATFCIVGENGSGKSTALQLAASIFPPTLGEVEINGRVSSLLEPVAGGAVDRVAF